jgi:hypothetical protein
MKRLVSTTPVYASRIRPYIGGEDVSDSPFHQSGRWALDLSGLSYEEAKEFPALLEICRARVKPERDALSTQSGADRLRRFWWWFGHEAKDLYAALATIPQAAVCSQTSKYLSFALLPSSALFSHKTRVIADPRLKSLGLLQSRVHQEWAYLHGSTMKDDPVYVSTDCFETFPFPEDFESNDALEHAGRQYHDFRAALMVKNDEGLTKTYNRFHDRNNHEPDIVRLRELHAAMDRAVLAAYGWHDIKTDCDFFADYTEEDEDGNEIEKSIRYRWPDEVRDEVLARLLALNAERHAEEVKLGLVSPDGKRLKRADDDEDGDADDADNDGDDAPAPKRVKAGRTKSAAATPKSATRRSAKGKQPKTPKARGKAASRSGRLLFGGDD